MGTLGKRRRVSSTDSDDDVPTTQRAMVVGSSLPSPRSIKPRTLPPGRNRRGFLEQSQLTDKDRRHVRCKERELLQSIKENANDLAKISSGMFDTHTQELDQMYENVCYPREANLDASNLDELNVAVAKQSQALGSSDLTKYDSMDLIQATYKVYAMESQQGDLDWDALGNAAGACFRSVPEISFLFGLMDTEVVRKERKKLKRVQDDAGAEEAQPTEYTNKEDRKDAQARRLEILQSTLIQRQCRQSLFDVVIDPKSFTQTVENLFDTSFLVRNNSAEIGIDDDTGLPYLKNQEGIGEVDMPTSTQSIISITPAQWEQLAQVTGRDEPLLVRRS
ncbi:unnamed protein product [Peronospora belbahrii]|uniref:Non-structural maintenance of chromosomes element 4 n=1 Tax=Peronospora belbahrii TaxID=622444 RepID=A0AAU9KQB4_9STRA|nr:unnamed protein product [Peronospora belbahrii]CAH0521555.1 unnamed protein product [Peronospora belbahrii]